jgi:hypothetical protein
MSRTRILIARLSLALRAFLYVALLGAVAYIGFGYSAGYVAIPGDSLLRLGNQGRAVMIARCAYHQTKTVETSNKTAGAPGGAAPQAPGAVKPGTAPLTPVPGAPMSVDFNCATQPMLGLRSLPAGHGAQIGVLTSDDGTGIEFRRDEGSKGEAHITIMRAGKTKVHTIKGKVIPPEVMADIPNELRQPLQHMLDGTPLPPPPPVPASPGGANQQNQVGILTDDDGTRIEFRRNSADGGKAHLTIRRGDTTTEHVIEDQTIAADVLAQVPEKLREPLQHIVAGTDVPTPPPAPFNIPVPPSGGGGMLFNVPVPPPGAGGVIVGPAGPGEAGDVIFLRRGGDVLMAPGPSVMPFDRVIDLPGPAIVQQQVLGHTGIRAGLVGITIALVFLAIIQLERLLAHFQRAELFSARNSALLRNLGLLLIVVAIVQAGATLLPAILANALHPALVGALGPHLLLVFAGSAILLLAAVMAEAGRLEEEAEHTV